MKCLIKSQVEGLVMTDIAGYFAGNPGPDIRPELMGMTGIRNWTSECECETCKKRRLIGNDQSSPRFIEYHGDITLKNNKTLRTKDYLLLPSTIPAFVFKTRTWGEEIIFFFSRLKYNMPTNSCREALSCELL